MREEILPSRRAATSSRLLVLALTVAGCVSPEFGPRPVFDPQTTLRVVTWNVHLGRPLGAAPGEPRIAEILSSDPALGGVELLALQELCGNEGRWQLEYFAEAMRQRHGAAYTAFVRVDPDDPMMCERGQALISAHPIVDFGRVELPRVRQTRAFLWADVLMPNANGDPSPLRVYVPHFENRSTLGTGVMGRLEQARAVVEHLEAWRAQHPGTPVLLLGDLNSVGQLINPSSREPAINLLSRHLEPSLQAHHATMTSWPWQVDWIFSGGLELVFSEVARVEGSDHWPVCADYLRPD